MDISTTQNNGFTVISITGSMDATTTPDFDAECKKQIDSGATGIIVDMSGIQYISSAGLRGILMLAKLAKPKNIKLGFCGMQQMVSDMFKLSGFLNILKVFADVDTAVSSL